MISTVNNLWTYGARSVCNCYRHWSSLVLWNRNGMASFLHSGEGVTQGEPIAMFTYGVGIPPLIKEPKAEFTDVTQPWYADNAGALGMFSQK